MLSRGGRKRRSSAYTVSATAPSTVISPIVSKRAEIDQHHVDDVGAAAFGQRAARGRRARCSAARAASASRRTSAARPPPAATASSRSRARRAVSRARRRGAALEHALRQPAQPEQEQHRRHHLDDELREREIGRREPHEGEAGDETGAAHQGERDQAVVLRLHRGADGAHDADDPQQHERGRRRHARPVAPAEAARRAPRAARAASATATIANICGCRRRVPTMRERCARQPRERDQRALEQRACR